jgi:hypothetical protein
VTALDILRESREAVTAIAALVAAVKSWLSDRKSKRIEGEVSNIKILLAQQQNQKQAQNITVNVGTGASSSKKEGQVTFSEEEEQ